MFFPGHAAGGILSLRPDRDGHLPLSIVGSDGPVVSSVSGSGVMSAGHPWSFLLMMDHRHTRWWIVRSEMLPGLAMLNIGLFGLFGLFVSQSPLLAVLPFKP